VNQAASSDGDNPFSARQQWSYFTWVLGLDWLQESTSNGEASISTPVRLGIEAHGGTVAPT